MKTITVLGKSVTISDELAAYNEYRQLFQNEAVHAAALFRESYLKNKSLDDVIQSALPQMVAAVSPAVNLCIKKLISYDILDIDADRFCQLFPHFTEILMDPYWELLDQYAEIAMDQKQLDEYRVARRQNRAKWVGGGFGISGAIAGTVTAGSLNLLSGAGHMVFNGIGKMFSSIGASIQKDKIFRDEHTYRSLEEGVYQSALYLHLSLIDCLAGTGADPLPFQGRISEEDQNSVQAVIHNLEFIEDNERCRDALVRIFPQDPYSEDWYHVALKRFGDQDGSLSEAADFFGVGVVKAEKAAQLEVFVRSLPLDTEAHALASLEKLNQKKKLLHFTGETEWTRKVQNAVEQFDREYRTVDGILLDTREEASSAREDLQIIKKVEGETNYSSLSSLAEAQQKIAGLTSPVAKKHQEALRKEQVSLDKRIRTVEPSLEGAGAILCDSAVEASELRQLDQEWSHQLMLLAEIPENEEALKQLEAQITAQSCRAELKKLYLAAVHSELLKADIKARTVLGKEYPTREAARNAEDTYNRIKNGIASPDIRKKAFLLRAELLKADFSEAIKKELLEELFQAENAPEIKAAKTISNIATLILLVVIAASYLMVMRGTWDFASKRVELFGNQLLINDVEISESMNFLDGAKNGLIVFGRSFGGIFVNGVKGYIAGFSGKDPLSGAAWAFLGLFWVIIKEFLLFFCPLFCLPVRRVLSESGHYILLGLSGRFRHTSCGVKPHLRRRQAAGKCGPHKGVDREEAYYNCPGCSYRCDSIAYHHNPRALIFAILFEGGETIEKNCFPFCFSLYARYDPRKLLHRRPEHRRTARFRHLLALFDNADLSY